MNEVVDWNRCGSCHEMTRRPHLYAMPGVVAMRCGDCVAYIEAGMLPDPLDRWNGVTGD